MHSRWRSAAIGSLAYHQAYGLNSGGEGNLPLRVAQVCGMRRGNAARKAAPHPFPDFRYLARLGR